MNKLKYIYRGILFFIVFPLFVSGQNQSGSMTLSYCGAGQKSESKQLQLERIYAANGFESVMDTIDNVLSELDGSLSKKRIILLFGDKVNDKQINDLIETEKEDLHLFRSYYEAWNRVQSDKGAVDKDSVYTSVYDNLSYLAYISWMEKRYEDIVFLQTRILTMPELSVLEQSDINTAYFSRALAFNFLGRLNEAIADLDYLIESNETAKAEPEFLSKCYGERASSYYNSGEKDKAITGYLKAIEIDKTNILAIANLADVYIEQKDYKDVLALLPLVRDYERTFNPNDDLQYGKVCNYLGVAYQMTDNSDQAYFFYQRGTGLDPQSSLAYNNMAIIDSDRGEYTTAISRINRAIDLEKNPDYYYTRGSIYNDMKLYEKAVSDFDTTIQAGANLRDAYMNRSVSLTNLQRWGEALADLDTVIKIDPHYDNARNNRASLLNDMGRYEDAENEWKYLIADAPDNYVYQYNVGNFYRKQEQFDKALGYYEKAIELKPDFGRGYASKAMSLWKSGRREEALHIYEQAKSIDPRESSIYLNRAENYMDDQDYEAAYDDLSILLYLLPDEGQNYYRRAQASEGLKDYEAVKSDCQKALDLGFSSEWLFISLAEAEWVLGNKKDATKILSEAGNTYRASSEVWNRLGLLWSAEQDPKHAIGYFEEGLSVDPKSAVIYNNLGNLYRDRKMWENAQKAYDMVLRINPKQQETLISKGYIYAEMGDRDKAVKYYNKVLAMNTHDPHVYINMGGELLRLKEYDGANDMFRQAIDLYEKGYGKDRVESKPGETDLLIGYCYQQIQEWDRAIDAYNRSLEANVSDESVYSALGYCYLGKDDLVNARMRFEQGSALAPNEIDLLMGLAMVNYIEKNMSEVAVLINRIISIRGDLKPSYQMISSLEQEGYVFTVAENLVLKNLFKELELFNSK